MKVCIICISKNEDNYINEWINYHLNLGFDNIIICNNDNEYKEINIDKVINLNYSKVNPIQVKAYTNTFNKYKDKYDWILFIDCDEFVVLEDKYKNIKDFLSDLIFKNADIIRLHWKIFSGGSNIDVIDNNYEVMNRFTEHFPMWQEIYGKSFIRTAASNYDKGSIYGHGYFSDDSLNVVNALGEKCLNEWAIVDKIPIHKNAWINHYPTKTIGEYIRQKYFRGGPNFNGLKYHTLKYFFMYNKYDKNIEKYGIEYINKLNIPDKTNKKVISFKLKNKDKYLKTNK